MAWLRIVDLHKATGERSQAVAVLKMVGGSQPHKNFLIFCNYVGCYVTSAQS